MNKLGAIAGLGATAALIGGLVYVTQKPPAAAAQTKLASTTNAAPPTTAGSISNILLYSDATGLVAGESLAISATVYGSLNNPLAGEPVYLVETTTKAITFLGNTGVDGVITGHILFDKTGTYTFYAKSGASKPVSNAITITVYS